MAGILETLVEWLVSVSEWFGGWDTATLIPALIVLGVLTIVFAAIAIWLDSRAAKRN